jgi:hypothetical protein
MHELASVTPALITGRSQRWRPEQPRHSGRRTGSARHSQLSITTNGDSQESARGSPLPQYQHKVTAGLAR